MGFFILLQEAKWEPLTSKAAQKKTKKEKKKKVNLSRGLRGTHKNGRERSCKPVERNFRTQKKSISTELKVLPHQTSDLEHATASSGSVCCGGVCWEISLGLTCFAHFSNLLAPGTSSYNDPMKPGSHWRAARSFP